MSSLLSWGGLELIAIAVLCGAIGPQIVAHNRLPTADSMTHAIVPGVVAGLMLGLMLGLVGPLAAVVGAAVTLGVLSLAERIPDSTAKRQQLSWLPVRRALPRPYLFWAPIYQAPNR